MNAKGTISVVGAVAGIVIITKLVKLFKYGREEGSGMILVAFLILSLLLPVAFLFSWWLGETIGARWVQSGDTPLIRHTRKQWAERGGCLLTFLIALGALMIFSATR